MIMQIKNLCKEFNGNKVLNNISFDILQGERIALIGSSGSGKTTLLRCLNYLEAPTSGEVIFDGKPLVRDKSLNITRQKIGMVFQNFNLFANMNVLKNLTLAVKIHNKNTEHDTKALNLLKTFGLENKAKEYPHNLSGGQKQRVAIARAMMGNPEIMLFDEPTSSLDPEMIKEVLDVINSLPKELAMVLVTHEMKFAKHFATKILFLSEGKITESGTPEQIFNNPQTDRLKEFLSNALA